MPHPKNPTPARIVPDGENWALPGTDIPAGTDPFQYAAGILAGIRSLVAERDALRKLVKEAYLQGALDQSHHCGLAGRQQGLRRFVEKVAVGAQSTSPLSGRYLVALAYGGVQEHPGFDYSDFDVVTASSKGAAEAAYNKEWGCDYFYGRVIRKIGPSGLTKIEAEQLPEKVRARLAAEVRDV